MSALCSLCTAFVSNCISKYQALRQANVQGLDLADPTDLVKDFSHYSHFEALCASAQQGCHLCLFLRLLINRGRPYELGRYVIQASEASLPIKLSQIYGDWRYDEPRAHSIGIKVPMGPSMVGRSSGLDVSMRMIYSSLQPLQIPTLEPLPASCIIAASSHHCSPALMPRSR